MIFLKKQFFAVLAFGLLLSVSVRADESKQTHKVQVILNTQDSEMFDYIMNTGLVGAFSNLCPACDMGENVPTDSTLNCNPFAPRPTGAYNIVRGQIYPGGTVSKKQNSYALDKHGNLLTADNSIGTWRCFGKLISCFDFFNLPANPTPFELVEWDYFFKNDCHGKQNALYTMGQVITGVLDPENHAVVLRGNGTVVGGSGCNRKQEENEFTAKFYISPTEPIILIKIEYKEPISIDN